MTKRVLSKSQANLYLQCPFKWKKSYIDKTPFVPSFAMTRGIRIHNKIEKFYKNMKPDVEIKNFINFELTRLKEMFKNGKVDLKYFFPIFQELKMQNNELGIKGIVDAVYINPKDDGVIVIDWKSGKYRPENFDEYRFELAVYAELLKASGKVDNVKYWGIYFVDADKLFFEEIEDYYIQRMYKLMDKIREGIAEEDYKPKKNQYCYWCQFKKECGV